MSTKHDSKALEFIYQDTEIHFLLENKKNVMVNATEMAKAFGKRVDHFTKSDHYKAFFEVANRPPNGVRLGISSEKDFVDNQGRNGVYFHRVLAIKFAAWLDVEFELWIYSKIEEVLFGKAKNISDKITDAENKRLQIAILIKKVKEFNNPDMNKLLLELEDLKKIENDRKNAMRQFSNQYRMF